MSGDARSSSRTMGTLPISFSVRGTPRPQGSKNAYPTKSGKVHQVESSKGLPDWRADVKAAAERVWTNPPTELPLYVVLNFQFIRPKSVSVKKRPYPSVRPDGDKLERAILDAITKVIFKDDCQVVQCLRTEAYGEFEGVHIEIREQTEPIHPWVL